MTAVTEDVRVLRARLLGEVVVPGDDDWDDARQAWNLAVDQRPAAVAFPESPEDVIAIVAFARERGLRVAPQGTGHNANPLGPLEDTILVKTSRMTGVAIDPQARQARVEAGVLWADVTAAAAEHGLAALAGSSPDVGVVGYTLGGGIGWLARKHGLAANSVVAVELVTADGRLVRADHEHESELFWAVRGGGGSFGVVTAIEFRLLPISEVYAGVLFWPLERASEVLHAWRRWIETVPDEVTSVGRIMQFPPVPDIPEPFRGQSFVLVEATLLGTEAEGDQLLRPLRELGPAIDTFAMIPASKLEELHMDPPHPVPGAGDGMLLGDLPAEGIDAFVAAAGPGSGSSLVSVELRHLGGALGRSTPEEGVLGTLDAAFALFSVGFVPTAELKAATEAQIDCVRDAMDPWDAGRSYSNFSERRREAGSFFRAESYDRLRAGKAEWDAEDVFRSNHPIPPGPPHGESNRPSGSRRRSAAPVSYERKKGGSSRAASATIPMP